MSLPPHAFRTETLPGSCLYGPATAQAVENFPISGLRLPPPFIAALGAIKSAAARANAALGKLPHDRAAVIIAAADEVAAGVHDQHFVVDVFQTGSGTSTNMNANEVIARRAEILSAAVGCAPLSIHPNDDVNMSQSSNDVIPSALHIAALKLIRQQLSPGLQSLQQALARKAEEFSTVIKAGRTHLQDAVPITLGQEFSGYAMQIQKAIARVGSGIAALREIPLGGTAVGTGLNAGAEFTARALAELHHLTGLDCVPPANRFEAQAARDAAVEMSGHLKTAACSLTKIAEDIRWLGSGPRCGLGEIAIRELQPGSSIMPGKTNPVLCEALLMVCAQVIGSDACITIAGQRGNFELNAMIPVIAFNLLQSIDILGAAARVFAERCVDGLTAHAARCRYFADQSLAAGAALAPRLGYDRAALIARQALHEGISFRDAAIKLGAASETELQFLLDPVRLTGESSAANASSCSAPAEEGIAR